MRKVALITGITGMVGSHLADYLLSHTDWDIIGLLRWRSPLDNISHLIPAISEGDRISLVYGDLKDTLSVSNAVASSKPDYIFHLAAQSYPKTSFDAPLDTLDTNIQGTLRLLEAAKQHAPTAKIHICSSSEVFGRVTKDKLPINEDCSFHPASPYAISKIGTDLIGRYYAEAFNLCAITTRMFTHTGPRRGDVFAESSFAKQIAMAEAGLIEPTIHVGNLDSLRTIADVRDAVRAYHMLLTIKPKSGESYNIGGSTTMRIGDILDYLINISTISEQINIKTDPSRLRPIDADLQVPDTRKFREHTGWQPEYTFEQTMTDLLNYWRNRIQKQGNIFLRR